MTKASNIGTRCARLDVGARTWPRALTWGVVLGALASCGTIVPSQLRAVASAQLACSEKSIVFEQRGSFTTAYWWHASGCGKQGDFDCGAGELYSGDTSFICRTLPTTVEEAAVVYGRGLLQCQDVVARRAQNVDTWQISGCGKPEGWLQCTKKAGTPVAECIKSTPGIMR